MDLSRIVEAMTAVWPHLVAGLAVFITQVAASAHAVMYKRDSRSAIGWVGIIWLVPILGAVLYVLLGINRIKRRAITLRGGAKQGPRATAGLACPPELLLQTLTPAAAHLASLSRLVAQLTARPLLQGNRVEPLCNGDEAYPAMLQAIDGAER